MLYKLFNVWRNFFILLFTIKQKKYIIVTTRRVLGEGNHMKKSVKVTIIVIGILLVIIGIVAGIVGKFIGVYNDMVVKRENVDTSFADLDVVLQRRADLIPNLVSTVKGASAHEQKIIDSVTTARADLLQADGVSEKAEANASLSNAISNFLVLVEQYPDIKSTTEFARLSDELAGSENRIATARRDYNNVVKEYNAYIIKFPNNIIASMFNMEKAEYFEADGGSKDAPIVEFD